MIHFIGKNKFYIILLFVVICSLAYYLYPLTKPKTIIGSLPGDTYYYAYETKWFCDNYFKGRLINTDLYAPVGVDMSMAYHMPALLTVGCLVYPLGPVAMFNFIESLQVVLIFVSSLIVSIKFIRNNFIRIFFVFIYSFSTFYLARIHGHTDILSTIWGTSLSFYLLYDLDLTKLRKVVIVFLFLVFIFASCWQNIPNLFVLILILMFVNIYRYRKNFGLVLRNITISGILFIILFAFFSFPMFSSFVEKKQIKNFDANYFYNADIISYFIPINGSLFQNHIDKLINRIALSRNGTYFELYNSIDYVVFIIFISSIISHKKHKLSKKVVGSIIALQLLLSFGPRLTIAGENIIELPYYSLLMRIPPFSITRTPSRLGIVVTFLITLYSLSYLDSYFINNKMKINKILLLSLCCYGIIVSTIFAKNIQFLHFDYSKTIPLKGLNQIRDDKRNFNVLNIPLSTLGDDASQNFLRLFHEKNIISGLISYSAQNDKIFTNIRDSQVLSRLGCANDRFPYDSKDKSGINEVLYDNYFFTSTLESHDIEYVIVNKDILKVDYCENIREFVSDLALNKSLKLIDDTPSYSVYRIESILSGENKVKLVYSSDWSLPWDKNNKRWGLGHADSDIYIYSNNDQWVLFRATLFHFNESIIKDVDIYINDQVIYFAAKKDNKVAIKMFLHKGENIIKFRSNFCERPKDFLINNDETCYNIGIFNVNVEQVN